MTRPDLDTYEAVAKGATDKLWPSAQKGTKEAELAHLGKMAAHALYDTIFNPAAMLELIQYVRERDAYIRELEGVLEQTLATLKRANIYALSLQPKIRTALRMTGGEEVK